MASETTHRLRLQPGRAADLALACCVFLLLAVWSAVALIRDQAESWPMTVLDWLLIVAASGALYWRRRYPVTVAMFILGATAAYYLTSVDDGPAVIALIVALYSVAAEGHLRAAVGIAAVAVIGVGAGTLAGNKDFNGVAVFMLAGWLVAVVALGTMRHGRFAFAEEKARRRATEERLRIARELHDVIGHNVSLINVQASAALHRLNKHPQQAAGQPRNPGLMVVFRSVLIPLKAALMNLLSIAAAMGVITLVFQQGWFGVQPGPIEAFIPVMIFAIVFGLSMDYEVFLISRIHEEWERTREHGHAVREGLAATGKVITAAAAIMIVVFAAFVLSPSRMLQQFGLGLAVAILLDALVIRCLIVPAAMQLLGRRVWWLPAPLARWLPKVALEHPEGH